MAVYVWKNARCAINGVNLSDHVASLTLNYGAESQDVTAMGSNTRKSGGGLKTWSVEVEFFQDHAAANVDATLFSLVGSSTFTVAVRPVNSARNSTNPEYSGTGFLESYSPMAGAVGVMAKAPITITAAGDLSQVTASTST